MPTYTSRNNFKQILTGEETDTWGVDENTTKQRIDDALDGVLTVAVNGSASLVYANDGTDQNHYAGLVLTGTGGTLHLQSTQGIYLVANRTSGNVTLTSGGANAAVLEVGDSTWIMNDGAGSVQPLMANGSSLRAVIDSNYAALVSLVQSTSFAAAAGNLPAQSGQGGNYLATNGSVAGWAPIQIANVAGLQTQLTSLSTTFSGQLSGYQSNVSTEIASIISGGALTGTTLQSPTISNALCTGATVNSATLNAPVIANPTISGTATLPYGPIFSASGTAGGRAVLNLGSSSALAGGSVALDTFGNQLRVFEAGGGLRGAYIDLTTCSGYAATQIWHSGNLNPSSFQPAGSYQASLGFTPLNKAGDTMTGGLTVPTLSINGLTTIASQQSLEFASDTGGPYYYQQCYQGNMHIWGQGGTDLLKLNTQNITAFGNDVLRITIGGQQNSGRVTVSTSAPGTLAVGEMWIQVGAM